MTKPHMSNPRARSEIRAKASAIARAERREDRVSGRLTEIERRERSLTEIDFQRMLVGPVGLASALGWVHVHFRPAKTERGWRTPGTGELAGGWPDLTLIRERDRRLIFAELKRELAHESGDQLFVLDVLRSLSWFRHERLEHAPDSPTIEVHVWRPSDLRDPIETSRIYEVLR